MPWPRLSRLREQRCVACKRLRAACICTNVQRGHAKAARRAGIDPRPRPCKCGRTIRNGVCPGPYC